MDDPSGGGRPRRELPVLLVVQKDLAPWTPSRDVYLGEHVEDLVHSCDRLRSVHLIILTPRASSRTFTGRPPRVSGRGAEHSVEPLQEFREQIQVVEIWHATPGDHVVRPRRHLGVDHTS